MGDRRHKKRTKTGANGKASEESLAFMEYGLSEANFDIQFGGGKSAISGQRLLWMEITQRSTGKKASGKVGTTKKGSDRQRVALLRSLLKTFRTS